MLPPFIIEQIRKREEEEEQLRQYEQPQVELPITPPSPKRRDERGDEEPGKRGVVILDI